MKPPEVNIAFAGDHAADRALAESLRVRLLPFAEVRLIDIDELERDPQFKTLTTRWGPSIYVVSENLLSNPDRRARLVASSPARNLRGRLVFYVCCGLSESHLRSRIAGLQPD